MEQRGGGRCSASNLFSKTAESINVHNVALYSEEGVLSKKVELR